MPPIAIAAGIGAVGSIAGAAISGNAAGDAADAQSAAANQAIAEQRRSAAQGQGFLQPFGDLGQTGIDQAGFLTDPNAQFDFLQNNPLFQLGLDNLNRTTQNTAASRGRLTAGDTLLQLNNNALLAASPLIQGQKNSINDLLSLGQGTSTAQANTALGVGTNVSNLLANRGDTQAAGIVGGANALTQGIGGVVDSALLAGSLINQPQQVNSQPFLTNPGGTNAQPFQFDLVNQ